MTFSTDISSNTIDEFEPDSMISLFLTGLTQFTFMVAVKLFVNFKEKIDEKHLNLNEIKKKNEKKIILFERTEVFKKVK